MCVCKEDVHEKREKRKRNENEKRNERIKKQERRENINLFIQINKQRDSKTNQGKTSQDEIYIDSLHIMKMTATITMTMTMTIIIHGMKIIS